MKIRLANWRIFLKSPTYHLAKFPQAAFTWPSAGNDLSEAVGTLAVKCAHFDWPPNI